MSQKTKLELVFNTDANKKRIIAVNNPRADVTKSEAEAAMQVLLEKNIFQSSAGKLTSISEARLHTVNSTPLA